VAAGASRQETTKAKLTTKAATVQALTAAKEPMKVSEIIAAAVPLTGPVWGHVGQGGVVCDIEAGHTGNHSSTGALVDGQLVEVATWADDGAVTRGYIEGTLDDTAERIY
jgi:hypothetical protein